MNPARSADSFVREFQIHDSRGHGYPRIGFTTAMRGRKAVKTFHRLTDT